MKKIAITVCLASTLAVTGMSTAHAAQKVEAGHYKVKKGDTLLEVADKFDISTLRLKKWNHLTSSTLKPGKVLIVDAAKVDKAQSQDEMLIPGVEAVKKVAESPAAELAAQAETASVESAVSNEAPTAEEPAVAGVTAPPEESATIEAPVTTVIQPVTTIQPHDEENDYIADEDYSFLPGEQPTIEADKQLNSKVVKPVSNDVAQVARQIAVGKRYVYGANSATQVDCSSFAQQVFAAMGKKLPRTTYEQMAVGTRVTNPQPGDLVFFNEGSHVGIYIGKGQMIDALNSSEGIKQRAVSYIDGTVTGYYHYQ